MGAEYPILSARGAHGTRGLTRGFSLIELMVTVAIVAIIASIAYPSYRAYVLKANRTDAIRALTQAAQILQRCYSQTYSFTGAGCPAIPATSPNGYYVLGSMIAAGPPATFVLTAAATGSQTADATCAVFTLSQAGQQVADNEGGTDESATCWGAN